MFVQAVSRGDVSITLFLILWMVLFQMWLKGYCQDLDTSINLHTNCSIPLRKFPTLCSVWSGAELLLIDVHAVTIKGCSWTKLKPKTREETHAYIFIHHSYFFQRNYLMTHRSNISRILDSYLHVGGKPWISYIIHTKLMYAKFSHPLQNIWCWEMSHITGWGGNSTIFKEIFRNATGATFHTLLLINWDDLSVTVLHKISESNQPYAFWVH